MDKICKEDLINLGYTPTFAAHIITEARYRMVEMGYEIYENKRIKYVPKKIVEEMLGFHLTL